MKESLPSAIAVHMSICVAGMRPFLPRIFKSSHVVVSFQQLRFLRQPGESLGQLPASWRESLVKREVSSVIMYQRTARRS